MSKLSLVVKMIMDFIWDFLNRKATQAAQNRLKESQDDAKKKVDAARRSADELERLIKSYNASQREQQANMRPSIKAVPRDGSSSKRGPGRSRNRKG